MSFQVYTPEQIPEHIDYCLISNEFRPTAVAFAVSDDFDEPRFVLVKSVHEDQDVWWPVQGGLDGRTPEETVSKELEDEINLVIPSEGVTVIGGMDYYTRLRDGFIAGKFLIACAVEYNSYTARMKPNMAEISDLQTVTKDEFSGVMA
jgi:hypothetical protein